MVAVGQDQYCGERSSGKSRNRGGRRGRPRPWDSRRGCTSSGRSPRGPAGPESIIFSGIALPVAVAVRRRVVDDGEAGVPSKTETDTVDPVVAAGAVSCVDLLDRLVGCEMGVDAARASAEPVPPSMGMAKPN